MGVDPPPSLSPSAIASFTQCPLAFKYSYVHRLPEPPSPWTSKGTLVHRALERLLDRPAPERTVAHALADLGAATADLADHPEFTGLTLTDAEWERFHADAERLVRRYFELEDPTTVTPVGLELEVPADEALGVGVEPLPLGVGERQTGELGAAVRSGAGRSS
ncbi:MAG: RecB family exonuclease, partial [Actinomycetota bacterium]